MKLYHKIRLLLLFVAQFGIYPTINAEESNDRDSLLLAEDFYEEGNPPTEDQLKEVNVLYMKNVLPIFDSKCLPCHGVSNDLPWYYSLPGAKQLIDQDIADAKKHLDMSENYPFQGHGTPRSDLQAIKETVKERSMPPLRYWIMHWGSSLNTEDERVILKWVEQSYTIINTEGRK